MGNTTVCKYFSWKRVKRMIYKIIFQSSIVGVAELICIMEGRLLQQITVQSRWECIWILNGSFWMQIKSRIIHRVSPWWIFASLPVHRGSLIQELLLLLFHSLYTYTYIFPLFPFQVELTSCRINTTLYTLDYYSFAIQLRWIVLIFFGWINWIFIAV